MANGRVKSILDSGYDTTLADFLDKIPQYVLQQQQLNDAKEERAKDRQFQQTQYQNQLTQQQKNNEFRQSQADYTKEQNNLNMTLKTIESLPFGQQYLAFQNLVTNSTDFPNSDLSAIQQMYKNNHEGYQKYKDIDDNYDKVNTMSTLDKFRNYTEMEQTSKGLKNLSSSISNPQLKKEIDAKNELINKEIKFLKLNAGKNYPDDQIPDNLKNELNYLRTNRQNFFNDKRNNQNKLEQFGTYNAEQDTYVMKPFPVTLGEVPKETQELMDNISSSISGFDLGKDSRLSPEDKWKMTFTQLNDGYKANTAQLNGANRVLNSFYSKNNLVYPELNADKMSTLEDPKEIRSAGSDPSAYSELSPYPNFKGFQPGFQPEILTDDTSVIEDEDYAVVNRNPELAEQFLRQIETGEEKDAKSFKDNLDIQNNYADIISQFNELDNNINPDALIGAGTEEIAVDDREREVIVDEEFNPANDFVENEEATTAPVALSPVSAGTRSDMEGVVPSQSEKISTDALFADPPKSTKENYNLKDVTGKRGQLTLTSRYVLENLGKDLKSFATLKDVAKPNVRKSDTFNQKQIDDRINSLSEKIKSKIGNYISPETGEFKNDKYNTRVYKSLQDRIFPELSIKQIQDLIKQFSTAKLKNKKS
tara:strand:- start:144 stop:2087 length:1944 start_codon:yes stop_codon:yes gene_type:complete